MWKWHQITQKVEVGGKKEGGRFHRCGNNNNEAVAVADAEAEAAATEVFGIVIIKCCQHNNDAQHDFPFVFPLSLSFLAMHTGGKKRR